uniref:C5 n=1 Tax=Soybean chlorotic blotch virus TaxID=761702 RepID=M9YP02_9GEMI|nr:C5 [Soybean chlorotic blotch virus]
MTTCHIEKQSILLVVLVLRTFLIVVDDLVINFKKFFHQRLLLRSILATSNCGMKLTNNLESIAVILFNCRCRGFIVEHVEHTAK